jgi:hypothetical protein
MVDINKSVIIVLVVIKIGVEFPSSILVWRGSFALVDNYKRCSTVGSSHLQLGPFWRRENRDISCFIHDQLTLKYFPGLDLLLVCPCQSGSTRA